MANSEIQEITRLGIPLSVKFSPNDERGLVEGYAATFDGMPDAYGDVISRGAFKKSLEYHEAAKSKPAMLWGHDPLEPIGRWHNAREDEKGLRVTGRFTLDVLKAKEAYALARDGALGLSIGYRVVEADRSSLGYRVLKQVALHEVSLVAMPANANARITGVKSFPGEDIQTNPRFFERFLRDAGFSKTFAVAVTNYGFKSAAASLRDADSDAVSEIAQAIEHATANIGNFAK